MRVGFTPIHMSAPPGRLASVAAASVAAHTRELDRPPLPTLCPKATNSSANKFSDFEIQALGEALAKDQCGLGGICVESAVDLAQITKEDAQSPTVQHFVQRVPGVTREERALAGFSVSTFEI